MRSIFIFSQFILAYPFKYQFRNTFSRSNRLLSSSSSSSSSLPTTSSKSSLSSTSSFDGYERSETKINAYQNAKSSEILMPVIILVNPFLDANVGSVSRSMLNFGLHELRIVDPVCNITSDVARSLSVGAIEVLNNAKIFPTLEEAVSDLQRVFATTVRLRYMNQLIYTPSAAAEVIVVPNSNNDSNNDNDNNNDDDDTIIQQQQQETNNENTVQSTIPSTTTFLTNNTIPKCGIVFGRERDGLTNKEVALADSIISIPTFKYFTSLNLAQAVNIVGYEMWKRKIDIEMTAPPPVWFQSKRADRMGRKDELEFFLHRLQVLLDERNYKMFDMRRHEINHSTIRTVFQRSMMTTSEIEMMHGVITALTNPKDKSITLRREKHSSSSSSSSSPSTVMMTNIAHDNNSDNNNSSDNNSGVSNNNNSNNNSERL